MGEDELLSRAISRLSEKFRVKAVIPFGSRSRGIGVPGATTTC